MAISYLNQYGLQAGTTSIGLTPPASTAAGDLDLIWIANKNSSVTPTNPAGGWTLLGQQAVGTGADGAGTGLIMLSVWSRILAGAATGTTVTITGANCAMGGGMVYRKAGGDPAWGPTISFGSDTSSGTGFSATVSSNLLVAVGDYLLSVGCFTAQTTLPGRNMTIPGVTNTLTGINSGGTANGNDMFVWTDHTVSTAGTQSAASTTTGTAGVATTGGALQVRVGFLPVSGDAALTAAATLTATPALAKNADAPITIAAGLAATANVNGVITPPTFTSLTANGSTTDLTSYITASVAPTGNQLVLVAVNCYIAAGSAQPPQPTVTGNGITYALVAAQDVDTAGTDRSTMWVFRGMSAVPSAGAITIDYGATTVGACSWAVAQSDANVSTAGSNGAGAIVAASSSVSALAVMTQPVAISPAVTSGNSLFFACGTQVAQVQSPKAGWTELGDVGTIATCGLETQFLAGSDVTALSTWTTSARAGAIAVEIAVWSTGTSGGAALSVSTGLTAVVALVAVASSTLTGTATLTATASVTRSTDAALTSTATLTATASKATSGSSTLTGAATLTAAAVSAQPATAPLAVTATLTADAVVGTAPILATAALTVTADRTAAQTSTQGATSALAVSAGAAADAQTTRSAAASITGSAGLTAAASVLKLASAFLTVTAIPTADTVTSQGVTAVLGVTVSVTAAGSVGAVATLTAVATVTAAAVRLATATAALTGTATVTASADVTHATTAAVTGTATITATATVLVPATAALTVAAAFTALAPDAITVRPDTGRTTRPTTGRTIRPFTTVTNRP